MSPLTNIRIVYPLCIIPPDANHKESDFASRTGLWQSVVALMFCTFFTCVCLNPSIHGLTIYFSWLVVFFDWQFVQWVFEKISICHFRRLVILATLAFLAFCTLSLQLQIFVRLIGLLISLTYLTYLHHIRRLNWLYRLVNFNIAIAFAQFCGYYLLGLEFAYQLGPTHIANMVWGDLATLTNTNFYAIFGNVIRVCGLSREAGFFASLVSVTLLLYCMDKKQQANVFQILFFLFGVALSFSKSTLMLFLCLIILLWRKPINTLPYWVTVAASCALLLAAAIWLDSVGAISVENESVSHRLGSPLFLRYMTLQQWFFGCGDISILSEQADGDAVLNHLASLGLQLCSVWGAIQNMGLAGLLIFLALLKAIGFKSSGLLALLIMTLTTGLFTSTAHVVLAYYLALFLSDKVGISDDRTNSTEQTLPFARNRSGAFRNCATILR